MLSATYRMSSRADNTNAVAIDPGNELLWRQNLRRIEAEAIRDTILAVSGDLNPAMGGRGFFPHLGGEVLAGASKPGLGWEISPDREQDRRSIYTFVKRSMLSPALDIFDYSNTAQPLGERPVTTVAPQSLMLLNDDFMQQQAAAFAARLVKEAGSRYPRRRSAGLMLWHSTARPASEKAAWRWITSSGRPVPMHCSKRGSRFARMFRFHSKTGFLRRLGSDRFHVRPARRLELLSRPLGRRIPGNRHSRSTARPVCAVARGHLSRRHYCKAG